MWVSWTAKKTNQWVLNIITKLSKERAVRHCQSMEASILCITQWGNKGVAWRKR